VGLGDKWGHGAGTWGGFRGPAGSNETFRVILGATGLGHGVGLGDKWGQVGTWGWDMGWANHSGPFYSEATHPSDKFMLFLGEYLLI